MGSGSSVSKVVADANEVATSSSDDELSPERRKNLLESLPEEFIQEFREKFRLFDKDKSGSIEFSELGTVLRALDDPRGGTDEEVKQLLRDAGMVGSKSIITEEDFLVMMAIKLVDDTSDEDLQKAFASFDYDGSGFVDAEELRQALSILDTTFTDSELSDLITTADTNKDGRIDYAEFCTFMKNTKTAWFAAEDLGSKNSAAAATAATAAANGNAVSPVGHKMLSAPLPVLKRDARSGGSPAGGLQMPALPATPIATPGAEEAKGETSEAKVVVTDATS